MAEVEARWEDMETDVLVEIFKELNMIELSAVSQVCHSWRLACSDIWLWHTFDLGLLKSNFIPTTAPPYIWVDDRSDRRLTRVLKTAMSLSRGNITCLIFHFNLYMKDDHLSYISERCPHLKRLVLPAWDRFTENGISQAIQRWQQLESLTMCSIAHLPYIMEEISRNCKNFTQLKVMGSFDMDVALAIAAKIPKLKVLSVRCSMLKKEALLHILDEMKDLEVLNISHCFLLEGRSTTFPRLRMVKELEESFLCKTSRLREFLYCQSSSCITCQDLYTGLMRWWKCEDWFWRLDEVNCLALGSYGKLFDESSVNIALRN